jgi:hypothetical protein
VLRARCDVRARAHERLTASLGEAVWADGKTYNGRLILRAGDLHFIVQRWECKLHVLTVWPPGSDPRREPTDADVAPPNPRGDQTRTRVPSLQEPR